MAEVIEAMARAMCIDDGFDPDGGTVKYYRFNAHELDFIGEPQRDSARAGAIAAFSFGVLINTAVSFSFGKPESDMIKGFWIAIGMVALVSSIYYYMERNRLATLAKTRLDTIKEEHDFGAG